MFKKPLPFLLIYLKMKSITLRCFSLFLNIQTLLVCWLLWASIALWQDYPKWERACLTKVRDGDTIEYSVKDNKDGALEKPRVGRLWHIDAFEIAQRPWGKASYNGLIKSLKFDPLSDRSCHQIYVKTFRKDKYGRDLILVKNHLSEMSSLNEQLLRNGWALLYPFSDWPMRDKKTWSNLQEEAKRHKRGIWKYPKKSWQSPWSFRKNISGRAERHRGFDQRSFGLEQKLSSSKG
jgi:endonuclease YncB( thermonuclease family)